MEDTNRVYRIRTKVGEDAPNVIHVPLNQSYDMFEILSLKLNQNNTYKSYESSYGIIVGRITANGGFGIPNAKVSVFIEVSDDETLQNKLLYNFTSTSSTDNDGVRYNLLPDYLDDACHQNVGTFPNKRLVLDNQDILEIFDKYWKYTTTTNHAGDYMLFGIPVGSQKIHVDVDLSDCGILSQRPRDMIGKGYNAEMFESPNKFKSSTNLNSLAQIISQDKGVYVYPYWGDISETEDKFSITRCDINLEYKFEPYAVFMGSIVTDKGSNAIGKNCTGTENNGKMSDLIAGEGTIEMIRKTLDGKVEEFPIMGNRLIDGDGVWCYQIPMNLDYVTTDEFGNLVPTDNPDKGIATRTRVRFRISLDENPNDATARKRAKYLVPNNPRIGDAEFNQTLEVDYEFGSATREESYCDMFWNKVYTVKNYIPKLQKNSKETNRKHTGIKLINHYDDNNPMPYNALTIKLSFTYRLICVIVKIFILLIGFLNNIISILGFLPCWLGGLCLKIWKFKICPFKFLLKLIPGCIELSSEFCDDGINPNVYYPGCGKPFDCVWTKKTRKECQDAQRKLPKEEQKVCTNSSAQLYTCVENELAQQNDATSFNFYNDWVNGVLYTPLWYRKITPKKKFFFGLFKRKAKDEWCSAERNFDGLRIMQACAVKRKEKGKSYSNFKHTNEITPYYMGDGECGDKCQKSVTIVKGLNGVISTKETMLNQTVFYYVPVEYDVSLNINDNIKANSRPSKGEIKLLFATDIVLLGSLNDCDLNGIPQFFKTLESTTYNLPSDILFTDYEIENKFDDNGNFLESQYTVSSEMAGCDWGNKNEYGKYDGGLFYDIGCSSISLNTKSCINLMRLCEYGVSLDETKQVPNLNILESYGDEAFDSLITDGFVSWDELYNLDERSMFATMNGNKLKTKLNVKNGLQEYDFRFLYPENFDGSLQKIMQETTKKYSSDVTYKNNYKLEQFSQDYYIFRMGDAPYFYDKDNRTFPRYENSFYFYFGLKAGKTAIEKFNPKYFSECNNENSIETQIQIKSQPNSWCSEICNDVGKDGYIAFDFGNIATPYDLLINSVTYDDKSWQLDNINNEKIIFYKSISEDIKTKFNEYTHKDINGGMLENGSYQGILTDNNGNITEFTFKLEGKYLSFKTEVQDFKLPNNVLMSIYENNQAIATNDDGEDIKENKQVIRNIGGVITIYDVYNNGKEIDNYSIYVKPKQTINGYDGVYFKKNSTTIPNSVKKYTATDGSVVYGINVPKGNMLYEITITEICCEIEIESHNKVIRNVLVNEPLPYKMYINDVDYDLIKNFNKINGSGTEYSNGWKPNGTINQRSASLQNNRQITFVNNPWFNIHNIWGNSIFNNISSFNLVDSEKIENIDGFVKEINDGTYEFSSSDGTNVNLTTLINEFTKINVVNSGGNPKVYYTWNGDYILNDYDENTFKTTIVYDSENIDDLVNSLNIFVEKVNEIISLRNELPLLMQSAFYLTCSNDQKNINIRVQTSDLPAIVSLVYQEETTIEDDNENTLANNNMVIHYEDYVDNINIPTITYACNEKYGIENSTTYEPVVSEVVNGKKKYQKHAYYVGVMNDAKNSIPSGLTAKESENVWRINESNELNKLFDFPIIDKVLKVNYISWAYIDKIPFYKKYDTNGDLIKETVTMNGVFAANIFNGNISSSDEFDTQTLCGLKLKLSNNLINNQQTYVEKRIVLGYNNEEDLSNLYSFNDYIVDETVNNDITQYAPLLPLQTTLLMEDENGCGISETIFGSMKIELTDESVNNCITGDKILEVIANNADNGESVYYSVISAENNTYPLNYAENSLLLSQISQEVKDVYENKKEYNIFSYKMSSDYFREGDNKIVDTTLKSQLGELQDDGSVKYVEKKGYGTTGRFNGTISKPIYIVAETTNHCRALSPVYDYRDVYALLKFGILERKEIEETETTTTDENGNEIKTKEYSEPKIIEDYKFGIAIKVFKDNSGNYNKEKNQYYLNNYSYTLEGVCKIDSMNVIEVRKETLNSAGDYILSTISENLYNTLKTKVAIGRLISSQLQKIINDTIITAVDYTGLKHICDIEVNDFKNGETNWYVYIWNVNLPSVEPGVNTYGIKIDDGYSNYAEDTYEKNETNITLYDVYIADNFEYKFLGWSENKPDETNIIHSFPTKVEESKVYYGNWSKQFK